MSIVTTLARLERRLFWVNAFERYTKEPMKTQNNFLLNLVKRNKDTLFGKYHNFSSIRSIGDYRKNVPVSDYKGLEPFIEMIKSKESNVLTKEDVSLLGLTSGTTGKQKFCPINKRFARDYKESWDIWLYYVFRDHPQALDGKIFLIVSPEVEGYTDAGMPYGSISGFLAQKQAKIIKGFYALDYDIFAIKNYESRYYTMLRIGIENHISLLVTPNPSMILLLARKAEKYKDLLIEDIRNGTISHEFDIEPHIRKKLESNLRPNPARAEQLKVLKSFKPKDYWPGLALIGCWKEGSLPVYLTQFPEFFGNTPSRDIGLLATEGRVSIPFTDDCADGILSVNLGFYEFIPVDDKHSREARTLTCDQLEIGKEYYVILTTNAGLYRYDLNDIIKVKSFYNNTPVIEFMNKGKHMTSMTGEKLTEWQVVNAVRRAAKKVDVPIESFTAVADPGRVSRYVILAELHDNAEDDALKGFLEKVDSFLMETNIEYRRKRDSQRLEAPCLHVVVRGGYSELHKLHSEAGSHDAQVKIPALSDDKNFISHFDIDRKIFLGASS